MESQDFQADARLNTEIEHFVYDNRLILDGFGNFYVEDTRLLGVEIELNLPTSFDRLQKTRDFANDEAAATGALFCAIRSSDIPVWMRQPLLIERKEPGTFELHLGVYGGNAVSVASTKPNAIAQAALAIAQETKRNRINAG